MKNAVIKFDIPAEILFSLNKNDEEFVKDIKHIVSVEMYRKGALSLGKCSELAGLPKIDFIRLLNENKVSLFNWDNEELENEINVAMQME